MEEVDELIENMRRAHVTAVDLEFSGIGQDRKRLAQKDVEERYQYIMEVVQSGSIFELGISLFLPSTPARGVPACAEEEKVEKEGGKEGGGEADIVTYRIPMLKKGAFSVTSESLRFLRHARFDFNSCFQHGLCYTRAQKREVKGGGSTVVASGNIGENGASHTYERRKKRKRGENEGEDGDGHQHTAARIVDALLHHTSTLVVHNGWLDLAFLLDHFDNTLSGHHTLFLDRLFHLGFAHIFDTKYMSFLARSEDESDLSSLFDIHVKRAAKRREKAKRAERRPFCLRTVARCVSTPRPATSYVASSSSSTCTSLPTSHSPICHVSADAGVSVAVRGDDDGVSEGGERCRHEVGEDGGGATEEGGEERRETAEGVNNGKAVSECSTPALVEGSACNVQTYGAHSAGFDAFATLYCFLSIHTVALPSVIEQSSDCVYLSGKTLPLRVRKSGIS
uniref:Uncharacterized protein n=1 Tax=Palpitomonas bilix TaxID=652834 RepID=A0A7S3CVE9_9EUKA